MVSDLKRVAERTAVLARALDVNPDLEDISIEIARRARLRGSQNRQAVLGLLSQVVDEPAHADDLWGWIVGVSALPDEWEADLISALDAMMPFTPSEELLDRTANAVRLAVNSL